MSQTPQPWIVVNTHPHKEPVAIANLANQGFGSYCPVVRKRVRHARRSRDVLKPLFPGYVFVETSGEAMNWRPILSTVGVRALVKSGDVPSRLDAGFIAALRAREVDGVIVTPAVPYHLGQQVRISDGPFDGLIARIVALDDRDRLVVLMDILNRPVRIRLKAGQVAAR